MADYYYDLLVVSCRGQHDTKAAGTNDFKTNIVPFRPQWNFTHEDLDQSSSATARVNFLAAVGSNLKNAPAHINLINAGSSAGTLVAALNSSATTTNDEVATTGVWHERVGKDVFRYEIGVSTTSAADALTKRTAHNLV